MSRRFPPPWSVDEENAACFIVKDHEGKSLAYVYFEGEPGRRSALGHGECAMCHRKRMVARFIFQFGRIVASSACGTRVGWKCSQCCTLCSMSSLRSRCVQAAERRKFQRARAAAE